MVVTDGESHDGSMLKDVIAQCNEDSILRFGIAVRRSSPVGRGGGGVGGKRSSMSSPPRPPPHGSRRFTQKEMFTIFAS